jgi:hypothetical protein
VTISAVEASSAEIIRFFGEEEDIALMGVKRVVEKKIKKHKSTTLNKCESLVFYKEKEKTASIVVFLF